MSPSSAPESSTAFPFGQLPGKYHCHSRTISCSRPYLCHLSTFHYPVGHSPTLQQDLKLRHMCEQGSRVCPQGLGLFPKPPGLSPRPPGTLPQLWSSSCTLCQPLLDSPELSPRSVAILLTLVKNSLLNFPCLMSCVVLVFCLQR